MTDPATRPSDAPPPAAVAEAGRSGQAVWLLLGLALGLGVRLVWAWTLRERVFEWEADGFVWAWEGRPLDALNRMRAPGAPWLFGRLAEVLDARSIATVRFVAVGLSLLGFLAALDLARSVARLTGLTRRSGLLAGSWMAWIWAVHPTLVASSVAPVPESLAGTAACVLLAGLARRVPGTEGRTALGVVGFLLAAAAASVLVSVHGTAAAAALGVGLLVYLAPVPRLPAAVGAIAIVACAACAGYFVQRGPDAGRPWLPDGAAVQSLAALTPRGEMGRGNPHVDVDLRDGARLDDLSEDVAAQPWSVVGAVLRRLVLEQIGPARFEPAFAALAGEDVPDTSAESRRARYAFGLFDVFLRGGLLLFVLTVLGLVGRRDGTGWPRGACALGLLAWLLASTAAAVGPWALAPFDLVLLGLAGAGVAGGDPRRARTRRLGFVAGGVMLCTLLLSGGWRGAPLSRWTTDLTHVYGDGRLLVEVLDDGGPADKEGHLRAATLLMQQNAPLLRLPEAALRHATEALSLAPDEAAANEAYVRALVENRRFAEAARVAEAWHTAHVHDPRRKALLGWVQEEQRRTRELAGR